MKLIFTVLFISTLGFAVEPAAVKKAPEPIFGKPKKVAEFDPTTNKVTIEKGVKPEEVYDALITIIQNNFASVQEVSKKLEECKNPKKESK